MAQDLAERIEHHFARSTVMSIAPFETHPDMLAAALEYLRIGWSVIPIRPRDKKPLIKWEAYQQQRANECEVRHWFTEWPDANIGIVTGSVSGMIVLDFDGSEGAKAIEQLGIQNIQTPVVKTGNGAHFYLMHPGKLVHNFVKRMPGFDLRGDGGYVVAPPSIHASGRRYTFFQGRDFTAPLLDAPANVLALLTPRVASELSEPIDNVRSLKLVGAPSTLAAYAQSALEREAGRVISAPEGGRNDALNRAAFSLGQLIGAGELGREEVESTLMRTAVASGLPEAEALKTIRSGVEAGICEPRDMGRVSHPTQWQQEPLFVSQRKGQPIEGASSVTPPQALEIVVTDYRLDQFTVGEPPRREWLVLNAIPLGVPGVIYGAGGIGKSMAALDLVLKVATRDQYGALAPPTFIGRVPAEAAGAAIFITLEDDKAEIHRRVANLDPDNKHLGAPCYVFPSLDIPGFDPVLIKQEGRAAALTKFAISGLDKLLDEVREDAGCPIRLLMLDPAGDLIEGDEDSAGTVKPLMRRLREIASRHGCTVILLGHVAKGETDSANLGAKGMRGSGAWTANARFAIGMYAPDDSRNISTLKELSIEPTPDNKDRVVFGMVTKANFPGAPKGLMVFLRDLLTGAWINYTDRIRSSAKTEWEESLTVFVDFLREAAEVGMPFQIAGGSGLYKRRTSLPTPLSGWGQKKLERFGNEALEKGMLVKCRATGSTAPCWLDIPDGPYATGQLGLIAHGSLDDLLAKKRAGG